MSPELKLEFHAHRSPLISERVLAGELTLGICAGWSGNDTGLVVEELWQEEMVLIGTPDTLHCKKTWSVTTIEEKSSTWRSIRDQIPDSISIDYRNQNFMAIAQLCLSGFGTGLIPISVAKQVKAKPNQLKTIRPKIKRPIVAICKKNNYLRPEIQHRIKRLRENLTNETSQSSRNR